MSTSDPIAALSAQTQAAANAARKKATDLGIEDFLTLMTAQLKNQDPMKPLDSTEFVAQLAQFGTVSGVQNMQASLTNLTASMLSTQALQGSTLVGHEVLAAADSITIATGETVRGEIEVPEGTSTLNLVISDNAGQAVRHINLPADARVADFVWDGLDDRGVAVSGGTYGIEAIANIGGENYALEVRMAGTVRSVSIDAAGGGLTLNTALGPLPLANVRRVM